MPECRCPRQASLPEVSITPDQAARKLLNVADAVGPRGQTRIVEIGARKAKADLTNSAQDDMGGDLSLSNWRGSRVIVGYDVAGSQAEVKVRDSKGGAVVHVLEDGAGAHRISRKKKRGRSSLKIGGDFVGPSVLHPGTSGKKTFTIGMHRTSPRVVKAMQEETHRLIVSAFGG
jgi:hypothetical protein